MDAEERWERIEKKTEFLLEQQARFEVGMEQLRAHGETLHQRGEALHQEVDRVVRVQAGLQDLVDILFAAQQNTERQLARLSEKTADLADSQKHTDERLNALIQIVDGLVHRPPIQ